MSLTAGTMLPFLESVVGGDGDTTHDLSHFQRVWQNCRLIAADIPDVDMDILLAVAYLHDLVNVPKDSPLRNQASTLSATKAQELLAPLGWFTEAQMAILADAIKCHSYSAGFTPSYAEGKILRDADRMDALGAIGFSRLMGMSAVLGRAFYHPTDPAALAREPDELTYGLDHAFVKLVKLPATMLTPQGQQLAGARLGSLLAICTEVLAEAGFPNAEQIIQSGYQKHH